MQGVLRAAFVFFLLIGLFRIAGRRSMNEMSSFELVLMLVVGESMGQAVIGKDFSLTNAALVATTLIMLNVGMSLVKHHSRRFHVIFDGVPLVIVEHGRPLKELMAKVRVGEDEILAAARELQGLERMEQIKYAVVESSGIISIIPRDEDK
jgi:uncharacterized membrane protein YcaP (DUF421 family)